MADPISSLGSSNSLDCHVADQADAPSGVAEPTQSVAASSTPLVSSEEASSSTATAGAQALVARYSPPPALPKALPVISQSSLSTSSGAVPAGGSYRVEANAFQAQVESGPFKGSNLEVGTAYVQYGKDNDVQLAALRRSTVLAGHGYGVTFTGEAGVARANLGETNDDGSIGGNLGAGVELLGAEVTVDTPGGSVTYGLSASLSLSGSMGVRDADHDGEPEFCAKFSVPAFTAGACVEQFW